MNYPYVPINRIFSKLIRDHTNQFNETDVIEWCGEALEFIGAVKQYEEAIAFIEVKNHQCELPTGLHTIIQIARNNSWNGYKGNCTPYIVKSSMCIEAGSGADNGIPLDCQGKPIGDYEIAYYRPYFDLKAEYNGWSNSNYRQRNFTPIRLATHSLFNTLVAKESNTKVYSTCIDEYTVILNKILRTSFKTGQVAIAYLRQVRDTETGYPMIPDSISHTTAITKYVAMMIEGRMDYGSQEYNRLQQDWDWYCGQASNADKMIFGIDEHQNLLEQRTYLLPNQNQYYGFFGNLNKSDYNDKFYSIGGNESNTDCTVGNEIAYTPSSNSQTTIPTNNAVLNPGITIVYGNELVNGGIDLPKYKNWHTITQYNGIGVLLPNQIAEREGGGFQLLIEGEFTSADSFVVFPSKLK